jgi:hypothetical protein
MPTVAEKAQAEEKTRVETAAGVSGAQAVADAVKRVADAAVAEAAKVTPTQVGDFHITGHPGGKFEVQGKGFSSSGSVFVNGRRQQTTEWGDTYIRGTLDAGVTSGEATIPIDEKKTLRGYLKVV